MIKLIILILAIPLCVQAQAPSPSAASNEPVIGTISGKVVNESGQPMAGVSAFARPLNSNGTGRNTRTDADGSFQINGLEPGLYTVGASAPAYTSMLADSPTYYRIGDSARVELIRGGVITGTVTNALGEPVIGVRVRATMIRDAKGQTVKTAGFGLSEQATDDRGVYRMFGLPPGTYLVSAGGFGSSLSYQFNPYENDVPTYAPSSTRDNAAEVSVGAGEENTADIRYRGETGYTISGTAKVSGTNGAQIMVTPVGNFLPVGNTFQPPNSRGFAFHGISDGEYEVTAQEVIYNSTSPNPVISLSEPKRITIKGASVTGIELVTKPLASLSGRISLERSKVPECEGKRPPLFSETIVRLQRPDKDADKELSPYVRVFGGFGSPDQNGAFMLRNLSPGGYQFEPRFFARYWYLQSITMGVAPSKKDAAATWTVVKHGDQLTNLAITLAEGAASIRGKLTGEPAAGTVVYLVPSEQDKAADVLRFFVSEIAADGTFTLNNLPPGRYWAVAQTKIEAQPATLAKLRQPEAVTARTKLRKIAETQRAEIELKPCQNITDFRLKQ